MSPLTGFLLLGLVPLCGGSGVTVGLLSFNSGGFLASGSPCGGPFSRCSLSLAVCVELGGYETDNFTDCSTSWRHLGLVSNASNAAVFAMDHSYGSDPGNAWDNPSTFDIPINAWKGFSVKVKAMDIGGALVDSFEIEVPSGNDTLCPALRPGGNVRTVRHPRPGLPYCGEAADCPTRCIFRALDRNYDIQVLRCLPLTSLSLAWSGTRCNNCSPCQNGGTPLLNCSCICPTGFNGTSCQHIICQNGGTSMGNTCDCPPRFIGVYCQTLSAARDCYEIHEAGAMGSLTMEEKAQMDGVYNITLQTRQVVQVYCDMTGGGWTRIQKRTSVDASVTSFNQSFAKYAAGFGNLLESFYLGNDAIHQLTNIPGRPMQLKVLVRECSNASAAIPPYALYQQFSIGDNSSQYQLNVSGYASGSSAGDSLNVPALSGNYSEPNNGQKFSTYDAKDLGNLPLGQSCALGSGGGWWYGTECGKAALNSIYHSDCNAASTLGIRWMSLNPSFSYSMNYTAMQIRPQGVTDL